MEQYRLEFEPARRVELLLLLDHAVREQVVALMAAVLEAIHKTRGGRSDDDSAGQS